VVVIALNSVTARQPTTDQTTRCLSCATHQASRSLQRYELLISKFAASSRTGPARYHRPSTLLFVCRETGVAQPRAEQRPFPFYLLPPHAHTVAMPPNKTKATSKKAPAPATPDTKTPKTPKTATKKRKVDWATIDDKELFQGFTVKPVKSAKSKKTPQAKKKLRTGKSQDGEGEGYRDAPLDAQIVQKNPFPESELSETHYLVDPATEWESTSRYRKFTSKWPYLSAFHFCVFILTISVGPANATSQSAKQSLKLARSFLSPRLQNNKTLRMPSSTG
jgi:hypothetical protein